MARGCNPYCALCVMPFLGDHMWISATKRETEYFVYSINHPSDGLRLRTTQCEMWIYSSSAYPANCILLSPAVSYCNTVWIQVQIVMQNSLHRLYGHPFILLRSSCFISSSSFARPPSQLTMSCGLSTRLPHSQFFSNTVPSSSNRW
jgi:hypothetical protein